MEAVTTESHEYGDHNRTRRFTILGLRNPKDAVEATPVRIGHPWTCRLNDRLLVDRAFRCSKITASGSGYGFTVVAIFTPKDWRTDNRRRWAMFQRKAR